jgi:hypothetical protein
VVDKEIAGMSEDRIPYSVSLELIFFFIYRNATDHREKGSIEECR